MRTPDMPAELAALVARIVPGAVLRVPAGCDPARPRYPYRLTVTRRAQVTRRSDEIMVSVRGIMPRPRGSIGFGSGKRDSTLIADLIEVVTDAPG